MRIQELGPWLLTVAIATSIVTGLLAAENRVPWSDEGEFSSASYNLAHHGFFGTTVLEPEGSGLTRIDRRTYWVMPLYLVGQAVWYLVFPASIFWTRAFSVLVWGPLLLAAFYVFLARLKLGQGTAALATGLLATSYLFIDNAAFARPDVMCCALGFAGIATYLVWREHHFYVALFAANLLVAASGLTHPNGVFHLLGLAVVVLWFDRRRFGLLGLATSIVPYLLAGALWGLYIHADPGAFRDQMLWNGSQGRLPGLSPLAILSGEIERYLQVFGMVMRGVALLKAYALAAYLAGVAGCLSVPALRRQPSAKLLLALLGVYFAALSVFNQKLSYYLIHIVPFYVALLSVWIRWLWQARVQWRPWVVAAVILLALIDTSGIVVKAVTRSYRAPQAAAVNFIEAYAQPGDRIYGSASLIYGLHFDPRLRDDPYLGLRSGRLPDMIVIEELYRSLYEVWDQQQPDNMREIHERLNMYRMVYDSGGYQVYVRRDL